MCHTDINANITMFYISKKTIFVLIVEQNLKKFLFQKWSIPNRLKLKILISVWVAELMLWEIFNLLGMNLSVPTAKSICPSTK